MALDMLCVVLLIVALTAINMRQHKWSLHIAVTAAVLAVGVVATVPAVRRDFVVGFNDGLMRVLAALGGAPE